MSIPSNITTITVTGKYLDFAGEPIAGQVKFYMSQVLIDALADRVIIPSVVTVDLDANGAFSTTLPATNDPQFNDDFTYLFEESFNGGATYAITLPESLGATVDITDLRTTAAIESYIQLVSYNLWPGLVARVTTQEAIYDSESGGAVGANTYANLYLFITTYAELTTTYATYSLLSNPEFNFNEAGIQNVIDRITALYDFTADSGDLRDTVNGGVVSGTTYPYLTAKVGTYGNASSSYATYGALTGANITWNYSQIGALLTNLGYALTDTGTLTDPYLSITRTYQANDYGALGASVTTYTLFGLNYSTYGDSTGVFYSFQGRDTADTLRTIANQPHRLLFMGRDN